MQFLYFLAVAIALYWIADRILRVMEQSIGRTLEHRTVLFFFILLGLALAAFALIRHYIAAPA
jgi:hypothetical protein